MSVFTKILPLFIIIPIIELVLLIQIGRLIGFWETIALVILTGIVGAWLIQLEGLKIWTRIQTELLSGRMPTKEMLNGLLVLIGGILLLTPGVVTDLFGLSLLLPLTRKYWRQELEKKFGSRISTSQRKEAKVTIVEMLDKKD